MAPETIPVFSNTSHPHAWHGFTHEPGTHIFGLGAVPGIVERQKCSTGGTPQELLASVEDGVEPRRSGGGVAGCPLFLNPGQVSRAVEAGLVAEGCLRDTRFRLGGAIREGALLHHP